MEHDVYSFYEVSDLLFWEKVAFVLTEGILRDNFSKSRFEVKHG